MFLVADMSDVVIIDDSRVYEDCTLLKPINIINIIRPSYICRPKAIFVELLAISMQTLTSACRGGPVVKPLIIGHSACWADELRTLAGLGSKSGQGGSFSARLD